MKRPILYALIPFILGIIVSHLVKITFPYLLAGFVLSAIISLIFLKCRGRLNVPYIVDIFSHLALYLAIFFLGAACYQNALVLPRNHIANFTEDEPKKVFVKGTIIDDPGTVDTRYALKKTSFTIQAAAYSQAEGADWRAAAGLVKVDLYSKKRPSYEFGDELILEGMLSRPVALRNPGLFDYSKYLAIKDIYSILKVKENSYMEKLTPQFSNPIKAISYKLRRGLRRTIDSHFEGDYASFMKAIFIGERVGLGDSIKDDFIKTGTAHILAISGLNVGLIAGIVLAFFGILRIPKRIGLFATSIFLIFYVFACGANPPIVRAVIMFIVFVIGYLMARDMDVLNSLSLAAILILLWNPRELFDPSFQLSFVCIASAVILCPVMDKFLGIGNTPPRGLREKIRFYTLKSVSVSQAAWIGASPIVAAYFNIVSPIAVIANLVIIPILFILTALSLIFFAAAQISAFVGAVLSGLIIHAESALFFVNHLLAQAPFSNIRVAAPSAGFLIIYYGLISLLVMPRKKYIFMALLAMANIFIWGDLVKSPLENLKIIFLDVGQGDAALVRLPQKCNILIDGGPGGEENRFDTGRSVVAPYLWNEGAARLDAVIVTHFHEDHLGGIIYVLKNCKVGCVIDNGACAAGNKIYDEYLNIIRQRRIRRVIVRSGDTIEIGPDLQMFVLNPEGPSDIQDTNDNSIALKLVYKDFKCLLCGDIQDAAMKRLLAYGNFLKSDVMKVPHHGGRIENERVVKNFFEAASPANCIISVGRINSYNMPSRKTIDIITQIKSVSYDTKSFGAVEIMTGNNAVYRITACSAKKLPFLYLTLTN